MKNIIWRSRASMLLALVVVLLPFLGLPQSIKNILFVVIGLLIAIFSFARSHYAAGYEADSRDYVGETDHRSRNPDQSSSQINEEDYSTAPEDTDE